MPNTPDSVKLWINTTFRFYVEEECNKLEQLALLKVGVDEGCSVEIIMRNFVASVVLGIAGMKVEDWEC